jgi:hypothetical protein
VSGQRQAHRIAVASEFELDHENTKARKDQESDKGEISKRFRYQHETLARPLTQSLACASGWCDFSWIRVFVIELELRTVDVECRTELSALQNDVEAAWGPTQVSEVQVPEVRRGVPGSVHGHLAAGNGDGNAEEEVAAARADLDEVHAAARKRETAVAQPEGARQR